MKKEFLKSKTVWFGLLMLLLSAYQLVTTGQFQYYTIQNGLTGAAIIALRDAINA